MNNDWYNDLEAQFWRDHNMERNQLDKPEPTREQKCVYLARKMGYATTQAGRLKGYYGLLLPSGEKVPLSLNCATEEECFERFAPNPYESADDSRALVEWLTTQPNKVSHVFIAAVFQSLWPLRPIFVSSAEMDVAMVFRLMTAPLETIADAAWLVITSAERPKAS